MVEISRPMFDKACKDLECHLLLHSCHKNCWHALPLKIKETLIGSAQFYAIVYLAQIAMRGKKMKRKEEWTKMGEYYLKSTIMGMCIGTTNTSFGCLFRWLMGNKFTYYTYLLIPNTINGLFIYLEPPKRRGLVVNLFANLVIEYWLRTLERDGYLSITKSKSKQVLMFMVGSALLFYFMRLEGDKEHRTPIFWLFTPEKVRRKSDASKNVCPHEESCLKYVIKGFSTYFLLGLITSLAQLILPKIRNPLNSRTVKAKDFKMALFYGSYISVYRAVICYLCRKRGCDSALYALPAGYLAGLSFILNPSLGFSIASLTAAAKLYSTILYEKKILPKKIPLPELLYCFCQGVLFHARFMHPDVCPRYVFHLMQVISYGDGEVLYSNAAQAVRLEIAVLKAPKMTEISKFLFDKYVKDADCKYLVHPYSESCWTALPPYLKGTLIANAKLFGLLALAKDIALSSKQFKNKEERRNMLKQHMKRVLGGALHCSSTFVLTCFFRHVLGRFHYYTIAFFPSAISGLHIFLFNRQERSIFITFFANLLLEYWLRLLEINGYVSITTSEIKQALVFMIGSSLIFYLVRLEGDKKYKTPVIWIFRPDKVRKESDGSLNVCPHEGTCQMHILKGASTYFGIGLAFSLARHITLNIKTPMKVFSSLTGKHLNVALFLGSYIGIFRAIICYLCRKQGYDSATYALPAGFLAGLAFLFSPNLSIAVASVTASLKLYATILYEKKVLPESIPLPELLYCFTAGTLLHVRFMHTHACSSYVKMLAGTLSAGVVDISYTNMQKLIPTSGV